MKIITLPNGNLEMRATGQERVHIEGIKSINGSGTAGERVFVLRMLPGYQQVKPGDVGALTDAPMIQDRKGNVWAFMDYQVTAFLEELAAGRPVVWQHGGKPEAKP